jgi:DNA-binding IclR family transcriptional regulator
VRKNDARADGVESVRRALQLLRLVASTGGIRLSEASERLGLPHSTVHRLLATLALQGYVARAHGGRRYVPGPALFDLGLLVTEDEVTEAAVRGLRELVDTFGETAHLMVLRGSTAHYAAGIESDRALRVGLRVGRSLPGHCCSGGKALLAQLSEDTLEALYPDEELPATTAQTITERSRLFGELAAIRAHGYAINNEESEDDIRAIASAIVDRAGRARGALVLAAPTPRLTDDDISYVASTIVAAADRVGATL